MELDNPGKIFLLNLKLLENVNHLAIAKLFNKFLFILWSEGMRHDNFLLFLTDAASYMVKAGKSIQVLYSKMVHITCIAHDLYEVTKGIRMNFSEVDSLISNVMKIFLKAPYLGNSFMNFGSECSSTSGTYYY